MDEGSISFRIKYEWNKLVECGLLGVPFNGKNEIWLLLLDGAKYDFYLLNGWSIIVQYGSTLIYFFIRGKKETGGKVHDIICQI